MARSSNVRLSDLKMKLIGAIVAISAVELLDAFLVSTTLTGETDRLEDRHPPDLRGFGLAVRRLGLDQRDLSPRCTTGSVALQVVCIGHPRLRVLHWYVRVRMGMGTIGHGMVASRIPSSHADHTYTNVIKASQTRLTVAEIRLRGEARPTAANKKML